jgi:hypothetical protein
MKFAVVLVALVFVACGCERKALTIKPTEPEAGQQEGSIAEDRIFATKEQIGAFVRVRVIAGGLPVANFAGAILRREEIPNASDYFDKNRCVAALLKGWTKEQLENDQTKILVFRNLPDAQGELRSHVFPGKLLQFDETTGIGLISYSQGFSAETDLGFSISRSSPVSFRAVALRFDAGAPRTESPVPSNSVSSTPKVLPAMQIAEGKYSVSPKGAGKFQFPEDKSTDREGESALVATAPAELIGFATQTEAGADLVRISPLNISIQLPSIEPVSATFSGSGGGGAYVQMALALERKNGWRGRRLYLNRVELAPGTKADLTSLSEPFAPIKETKTGPGLVVPNEDEPLLLTLAAPLRDNAEISYLLQLGWAESEREYKPSMFTRPFVVTLTRKPEGVVASTDGISSPPKEQPQPEGNVTRFPLEAPVSHIFEIAEGREVLMQFVGDPFWKRFSMEKKEWLALPPANYSSCDLAGNRSSIFVLDRSTAEIRRYRLSDLQHVSTAKLNVTDEQVFAIRAGCDSDRAPVHVLCSGGPISLDPETLLRIDNSDARDQAPANAASAASARVTGDGISLRGSPENFTNYLAFRGNVLGLRQGYFDSTFKHGQGGPVMVSAAFNVEGGAVSTCAQIGGDWKKITSYGFAGGGSRTFVFPNAPIFARFVLGDPTSIPPAVPRMELYNFFVPEPFADLPVPELAGTKSGYGEEKDSKNPVCIDAQSRRIGILTRDRKTWCVREYEIKPNFRKPLVDSWPDTSVHRGGEFRFEPTLGNGIRWSAELLGPKEPTPVTVDEKGVSFRVAENELASLLVLNLTITGQEGSVAFPVPIHVQGTPLPLVWPDLNPGNNPDEFAAGFKTLIAPKDRRVALKTQFYSSPDRILEIPGAINGIVPLVTDANRVDFLALDSHKVVGSIPTPEKAKYYSGNGALFEYDTNTRAFTRINVPDGRRGARLTLPADVRLDGIAFGNEVAHPISLFLVKEAKQGLVQLGTLNSIAWQGNSGIAVLHSETFQGGGWMQPQVWTDGTLPNNAEHALNLSGFGRDFPMRVAGSRNGSILSLRTHFALITPRFSMVVPYSSARDYGSGIYAHQTAAEGSITGIVATNSQGGVSKTGIVSNDLGSGTRATPCGRYILAEISDQRTFEVRSLENRQPLFRLNRLAALRADRETIRAGVVSVNQVLQVLQDNGPAVIRSRGGKLLQFIDLDIPKLASQVTPDRFHVISQPMPVVVEGGVYEYQVQVNNPNLISGYKLRDPLPNRSISPSGLFRFSATQTVHAPTRVPLAIEIFGRNGSSIVHEFSIMVISRKLPSPATRSTPLQTPARGGARPL